MSDEVIDTQQGCGEACSCSKERAGMLVNPIGRRRFVSLGVYAAATAALAACSAGGSNSITPPGTVGGATIKVSDFATLANVGGVAVTSVNGTPVAVVRTSVSTFITLSRVCPHQGTTVNSTPTGFKCPNHGATFDTKGNWIGGQRTSNMQSYTTSYDAASGVITIG